jgi:hypothetical protein
MATSRSNGGWPFDPLHPESDPRGAQEGERRKDLGMDRVEASASPDFAQEALAAIYYVATLRPRFTTDPVWTVLERRGIPGPKEPRVLGPLITRAIALGWLEMTNETRRSVRPQRNRGLVRVCASLIYHKPTG